MGQSNYQVLVTADAVFVESQSSPDDNQFVFAYTMTITNAGSIAARLLRRYWLITDADNNVQEVRGDGVIGQQPYLLPGESFQYTSGAVLETPVGCMQGSYEMLADDGVEFEAPITAFRLFVPHAVN